MDNTTKILIGLLVAVGLGIAFTRNSGNESPAADLEPVDPGNNSPATVPLDMNLILKKGMRGQEVTKLQQLIGAATDGIFGPKTENLLFAKKGVRQISLNQYAVKVDVNHSSLPVGTKIMAFKKPATTLYKNKTLANGVYTNLGTVHDTVEYGDEIGTIIALPADRVNYVVNTGFFGSIVWVRAADVAKI